jgi:hypothetical protein
MRPFHHPSLFQCLLGTATVQFDYHSGQYLFGSYFGISLTNAAYDYVVVGGGTGGLVVASCHGLDKLWKWNVVCFGVNMYE